MKRTILIASLTLLASATAVAADPSPSDYNKLDTTQFCVYKNEVYSKGSKVKMGDKEKICARGMYDEPDTPLSWM